MPRVDPEEFGEEELARIFMTPKIREARRAEEVLTERGVKYVVLVEAFGRTIFGFERSGASFYVMPDQADSCADALRAAGLARGIVPKDAGEE